jgi:glucoamylase
MSQPSIPGAVPFGAPGIEPRWTSSSKDGVGTAYNTASRVWFTISHGILNEVYYPTIDRPQIRDLEFLITDGDTFFDEEKRDLDYSIRCNDEDLGYTIDAADRGGRYRIAKEIICDPHQPCVLVQARLVPAEEWRGRIKVYVLLAPHLEAAGAGNSARTCPVSGRTVLVAWRGETYLALGADTGFAETSIGYAGSSDGWQDLHDNYRLDWRFDRADGGNLGLIGRVNLPEDGVFVIGLAFGDGRHAAMTTLAQSLSVPFDEHRDRFRRQWLRARGDTRMLEERSGDGGRLFRVSHKTLLAHEDKTFAGAFIASASIPWGEIKGDEDIGGYHLVWTRDMVHCADALLALGDLETPRRALVYLACSQQNDGGFAQNFWLDGTPYWRGVQLDQAALPLMLAWRLWKAGALARFDPYPMVLAGARFLVGNGPATAQDRWEEASGLSPSTIAASIAALVCTADICRARGNNDAAAFLLDYADFLESHVDAWTVTTAGTLVPGIPRHYVRITPASVDDAAPNEDPNSGQVAVPNRPPGSRYLFGAGEIVSNDFLDLVRYGIRRPDEAIVSDSVEVADRVLRVETPFGPCWRRYNNDGYGQRDDGGPFAGWGTGRAWPLLTGERAHYELARRRDVSPFVRAMEGFTSKGGMLAEQVWDADDIPSRHMRLGRPTGSAMPLAWAHAEYVRLLRSIADDWVFDCHSVVSDRYWNHKGRGDLEVWKPNRQVRRVRPGVTLRILADRAFTLRRTSGAGTDAGDTQSRDSRLGVHFADVEVDRARSAPLTLTFRWTDTGEWEGREYSVEVAP